MPRVFKSVGAQRTPRSVFDLSYEHLTTCDMGELIPIYLQEVVPGDVMSIGNEVVVRLQPMVAPVLHEINVFIHYFFVPYRILWPEDGEGDGWESFITGGPDGTLTPTFPRHSSGITPSAGGQYDYFGWPVGVQMDGVQPSYMPRYAYNKIYNDYYRDQTSIAEVALTSSTIKLRAWEKDYFTSALPWQQRGTAPALSVTGVLDVDGVDEDITLYNESDATLSTVRTNTGTQAVTVGTNPSASGDARWGNTALEVDLDNSIGFDVADLRLAVQTQRWLERNARAGARYTEFIRAHFGNVEPRDDRLDRPEYIGGSKTPVMVSEVLQTQATDVTTPTPQFDTPQGNMAGHGLGVGKKFVGKYRVQEYGIIMGILSVMPKCVYASQGMPREWLRYTKLDFYFPEFANLSEQEIYNKEIYVTDSDTTTNNTVFGYQGRFDEMRHRRSIATGLMRSTFDYWHLARIFTSVPTLGQTFLECDVSNDDLKRPFADTDNDACFVHVGNIVRAVRPIPVISNPGLVDH